MKLVRFCFLFIRFDSIQWKTKTHKAVNLLTFGDHVHTISTWLAYIWFVFVICQHENALHIRNAFTLIHLHASGLSIGSLWTKRSAQCNEFSSKLLCSLVLFLFPFFNFFLYGLLYFTHNFNSVVFLRLVHFDVNNLYTNRMNEE